MQLQTADFFYLFTAIAATTFLQTLSTFTALIMPRILGLIDT